MQNCKKYKPSATAMVNHHRNPKGDCRGCMYFSKFNCGTHRQTGDEDIVFS